MKSIFEIQDGDAVEEEYAVPGYPITVRTIGSLLDGGVRLEVYFGGRHDHYLTSTLHRFDGYDRNRDTMLKVGMWLQKECARADEIIERAILGDLMTPGCLSPRARERREASADEIRARIGAPQDINTARFSGEIETRHYNCRSSIQSVPRETLEEGVRAHFGEGGKAPWPDKPIQELAREQHEREIRESPDGAFLVECLRRDGVEVESVRYDLLGDRFDVECRSTNGQYFTAGVPVKVRRPSPRETMVAAIIARQVEQGGVDTEGTRHEAERWCAMLAECVCEGMQATTLMGSLKLRRNDMWGRENVLRGTPLGRP